MNPSQPSSSRLQISRNSIHLLPPKTLLDWSPDTSRLSSPALGPSSTTGDSFTHLDLTDFLESDFNVPPSGAAGECTKCCRGHDAAFQEDGGETRCCSICYEEFGAKDMARLPDCHHTFCRGCLIEHVRAKMSDLIFPIYCPLCACDYRQEGKTEIDQRTLNHLRDVFPVHEFEKFEILQLSRHAMSLQCPDCKHEMMIAREDLDNVLVTCPVPTCNAIWCRACSSTVSSCSKFHRCRQDAKFRRLVRRKRWRFCPGCRTPIQRNQGCSHMTCSVPGCNTHFCYRCGGSIWKPGQRGDSWNAAKYHNRWCRMVFPFGTTCPIM